MVGLLPRAMVRCKLCQRQILFGGYSSGEDRFCSLGCFAFNPSGVFCDRCYGETTDKSPGSSGLTNYTGSKYVADSERCPTCHSAIVKKRWRLFGVTVAKVGVRYRVLFVDGNQYVGRRMRE